MLVYKIDKLKYSDYFPPRGSFYSSGRWSKRDMWVVYTSENIALAKLETLANTGQFIPKNRVLRVIELKEDAPIVNISIEDLPDNWSDVPYSDQLANSIRKVIESKAYVAAIVPSVQSVRERNFLLFPDFPDFDKYVRQVEVIEEYFDRRLK
ncbi:RES family NAD+ phosphorylase [Roseivirga sp. 4D4]|uniref:RES family NAD+ phosphorylase n=1 Tax=Roseivirga sp. 4D4 TaxID=1889784 RepID=UPI0009F518E4|nr:RES family NAD+ phosphorylase [Roseivirga sp. 4D4]